MFKRNQLSCEIISFPIDRVLKSRRLNEHTCEVVILPTIRYQYDEAPTPVKKRRAKAI